MHGAATAPLRPEAAKGFTRVLSILPPEVYAFVVCYELVEFCTQLCGFVLVYAFLFVRAINLRNLILPRKYRRCQGLGRFKRQTRATRAVVGRRHSFHSWITHFTCVTTSKRLSSGESVSSGTHQVPPLLL